MSGYDFRPQASFDSNFEAAQNPASVKGKGTVDTCLYVFNLIGDLLSGLPLSHAAALQ